MSFSLKLDISTADVGSAYSITGLIVEKVKSLQHAFKSITGIEVLLFESNSSSKGATLSINTEEKTIVESGSSKNWEDAVMSAYDRLEQSFRLHTSSISY